MKHLKCNLLCVMLLALCLILSCNALASQEDQGLPITIETLETLGPVTDVDGESGSYVRYPTLASEDPTFSAAVEKINQAIAKKAHIPAYLQLLSTITPGSSGLRMDFSLGAAIRHTDGQGPCIDDRYLSILFSVEGKMLTGRPSHAYYPMTFDLFTGEEITFDQLFTDPDGAKSFIETYLENEVEPTLSTYLENNQLFPVPYDRFFLDSFGHVMLAYENSQLSFLSGTSGAVSFRYSQLSPWLDLSDDGIVAHTPWQMYVMTPEQTDAQRSEAMWTWLKNNACLIVANPSISLGTSMELVLKDFHATTDSGYYPNGAYFEVEEPVFRGALILTDENEERIIGIQTNQIDLYGISTGATTLEEAEGFLGNAPVSRMELNEAAAEIYHVCPGHMLIYPLTRAGDQSPMTLTLYADEEGIVQYIKLAIEK
ncbi:MAG: hypothetical protein IJ189_11510 [Clostridia bacterium]|nr:hypothetical protein [Clostridia bacterium]